MQSCDAGAKGPDGGQSNVAELADEGGIAHSNAYGCTGPSMTANASMLKCDGTWVDGDGKAASDLTRANYGLYNCNITQKDSAGHWLQGNCQ